MGKERGGKRKKKGKDKETDEAEAEAKGIWMSHRQPKANAIREEDQMINR